MTVGIKQSAVVYRGWSTVTEVTLSDGIATFTREVEDHGSAVAVLPYDPERRVALLVRMLRAPVMVAGEPDLLEVPAGLVDDGESLEGAARREAEEEVGIELHGLTSIGKAWTCPGLSTERISLFLAAYTSVDRIGRGGGLAVENENITVVEKPLAELAAMVDDGRLPDLKTFALVQTLRLKRPDLF